MGADRGLSCVGPSNHMIVSLGEASWHGAQTQALSTLICFHLVTNNLFCIITLNLHNFRILATKAEYPAEQVSFLIVLKCLCCLLIFFYLSSKKKICFCFTMLLLD